MKKTILLILLCLLLVGCKAEYNIKIENDHIYDSIKIYEDSEKVNNATNEQIREVDTELIDWERGYEDYTKELYTKDNYTGYEYKNDYFIEEYSILSQLSKCYNTLKIINTNSINIKSSNEFLCATYYDNVDELKIIINTEYKIIKSNADFKEDNKHTWIINKNNYKNKPIELEILKEKNNKTNTPLDKDHKINSLLFIIIFILLIYLLIKLNKKNRKIKI